PHALRALSDHANPLCAIEQVMEPPPPARSPMFRLDPRIHRLAQRLLSVPANGLTPSRWPCGQHATRGIMQKFDLAIVGAGPAGLAAAQRVTRAGLRPEL